MKILPEGVDLPPRVWIDILVAGVDIRRPHLRNKGITLPGRAQPTMEGDLSEEIYLSISGLWSDIRWAREAPRDCATHGTLDARITLLSKTCTLVHFLPGARAIREPRMNTTILLADNEVLMRDGLCAILEKEPGLQVVGTASTGRQALTLCKKLCPDLVLIGIEMQDLNGVDATRRIVTMDPKVKVIAISRHVERQFVLAMLEAGARTDICRRLRRAKNSSAQFAPCWAIKNI